MTPDNLKTLIVTVGGILALAPATLLAAAAYRTARDAKTSSASNGDKLNMIHTLTNSTLTTANNELKVEKEKNAALERLISVLSNPHPTPPPAATIAPALGQRFRAGKLE